MSDLSSIFEHGDYAGYQAHKRWGIEPCQPCRDANAAYHRNRRATNPEARDTNKKYRRARESALAQLAREQPRRYAELYSTALAKVRLAS